MLQSYAINMAVDKSKSDSVPDIDLAQLFQEHYPRIYNYLRYRVNSVEDVEDLISTIFERAYTRREQFDSTKGAFSTWLFGIAHNTLIDHYRKRKRRAAWETDTELPADLVTPEASLETQVIEKEALVQVLRALDQLKERDQEIISLKFAGRLRNIEIGQIMEMKEKTVSVALLRAVRRLRQEIDKEAAT